ncbi:hypothetical protein [Mycobacterium montefiorense]|uniref:hypothetical protein n=1 Tax=Mycobacterium montefiorense TaxID=154654 RepID=UPI0021DECDA6|nr:hypothetical protein [Mycobacterium montefiorense]MCV7429573.1 hypothetical protein [Mycobacterium montefiorense]GLE51491.1 hypothetical protein ATCCBAA256_10760 [Mycobacterium montefiorense]
MLTIPKAVVHRDTAASVQPSHLATDQALRQAPASEPVLVTECQVMFATAAALGAPRPFAAPRPWLHTLWHRLLSSVSTERPPRHQYPPLRSSYWERAATAREMDRL